MTKVTIFFLFWSYWILIHFSFIRNGKLPWTMKHSIIMWIDQHPNSIFPSNHPSLSSLHFHITTEYRSLVIIDMAQKKFTTTYNYLWKWKAKKATGKKIKTKKLMKGQSRRQLWQGTLISPSIKFFFFFFHFLSLLITTLLCIYNWKNYKFSHPNNSF